MLARCPSCRNTFTAERPGRQDCPACGKPLVVPEAPRPAPAAAAEATGQPQQLALPPEEQAPVPPAGTPWERRDELGLWTAWMQTMQAALFEPQKLFAAARLDQNRAQLGFAVATSSVFWMVSQVLDRLLFGAQRERVAGMIHQLHLPPGFERALQGSNANSVGATVVHALLAPLIMLVFLYASAGVTHLFALLFGQNRRGFPATFAAVAYGFAPFALLAVPGCGALIALVWCAVLTGIGMKQLHGITPMGAVATALTPYLLLCCAACAAGLLVGMAAVLGMHGQFPQ